MWLGSRIGIAEASAVALLLSAAFLFAAPGVPILEPTVTEKEARLLEQAAAVAETNKPAAVALLDSKDLPKASAALDFAIGNFQFQQEAFGAAATSYRSAIAKLPAFRNARKNLGRIHLLTGKTREAIAVYQSLVADGLADSETFLILGHALAQASHLIAAENAYRQVLLLDAENRDAEKGLAQSLLEQKRYTEASSLLRHLLEEDPNHPELWSLLANVYVALDSVGDAIRSLETARRLDCCSADMLGLLGDLYLNAGQPADAMPRYEDAIEAGWGRPSRLVRAIEGFILLGDAQGADRLLKRLDGSENTPGSNGLTNDIVRLRAELAVLRDNRQEGIQLYRTVTRNDPLNGKALLRLGDLLQQNGDLGAAALAYERAGRIDGMEVDALVRRAQLEVQLERYGKAVELLEAAQTIKSQSHVERYLEQVRRLAEH